MSTHKYFDRICCVVIILIMILSLMLMNAEAFGIHKESYTMGYEEKIFNTSTVHTLNIIMDDWEDFTAHCQSEEYYNCTVVIDDETFKNVAIRGKGNTSLTQVASYGNDRYSFKIEFDHYDDSNTYYGLDKLCLNNIIQDNTYMKDYLTYQMMSDMNVASPLCSYVYITVNGEEWGLYLAIEGVEESFLKRNFGEDYGDLYKPDSMNMGGGRGNGKQFDMQEFMNDSDSIDTNLINSDNRMQIPEGQVSGGQMPGGQMPGGQMPGGQMPEDRMPEGQMPGGQMPGEQIPGGQRSGGMNKGSDDVLLKYIDDEIESYSNIFDNAKTNVTKSDKMRLIKALKQLSSGGELSDAVEIESVIRYFVVHNFVLNFDSYTGSMIHNYYLYENDGQMQMIPWDYNLAFGGFLSMGEADNLVNYPIDTPVSGGNTSDRPMIAWIFEHEEYTERYHAIFAEFMAEYFDSGYFEEMFDSVSEMLAPYVEKDPTKFCTYEEFEKGISTLREFCLLRAESIEGQLNGSIGSTDSTQDSSTFVDAGELQISDMGTMNHSMGADKNRTEGEILQRPELSSIQDETSNADTDGQDIEVRRPTTGMLPSDFRENNSFHTVDYGLVAVSCAILIGGLVVAIAFKRRRIK